LKGLARRTAVAAVLMLIAVVAARAGGAEPVRRAGTATTLAAESVAPVAPSVFRGDVRRIPGSPRPPAEERPQPKAPTDPVPQAPATDPVAQSVPGPSAPSSGATFAGLDDAGWGDGWPPDPNGDVGASYYVQTVNTSIGIFDKSNGSRVAAFTFNNFFSQSPTGTPCDLHNQGDPVALYDTIGGRFIVTDFAWSNYTSGAMYECMAVSRTSDPVNGGWYFYAWQLNSGGSLPDYPKLGVWPDGIYMSANMFATTGSQSFQNAQVWAFNRQEMELGTTAHVVSFSLASQIKGKSIFSLLPSNARVQTGLPPSGTPNYFSSIWGITYVRNWKFHVDWANTANSTLTGPTDVLTQSFGAANTVPEKSPGNALDTLSYRLMMQNQYTNIGGTESLWLTHTIQGSGGVNTSQIRWYQLVVTGGTISSTFRQQSTYAPDSLNRFMPSLAVDKNSDMAIGYSVSDSTMYPAIRYTGRLAGDTLSTLGSEATLIQGNGYQCCTFSDGSTNTRWGDYSAMTLAPDGCTFWYTNEYYDAHPTTLAQDDWLTRIASFTFAGCSPTSPAAPTVTGFSPTSGPVGTKVVITGTNLAAPTSVSFHGTAATSFAVDSPTQITAFVPTGATTGTISVTTGGGTGTSSGSFTVTTPAATLSATPSSVSAGGSVTVSWSNVAGPTNRDWIGLFRPGDPDTAYIDWLYDDNCTKTGGSTTLSSGNCSFPMPSVSGTYEFRLFANDGYTLLATSGPVTVTGGATLSATPSSVSAGGTVTVSWSSVSSPTNRDWIGLYHAGDANNAYIDWLYDDNCTKTGGNNGSASGTCSFTMPNVAGTYEFRLFKNDTYTIVATSNSVTVTGGATLGATPSSVSVGGTVTVSWSNVSSPTSHDWIGLYHPGDADSAFIDWKWDNSCTQTAGGTSLSSGNCSFTMPNVAGTYEFRLFSNNTYTLIAKSGSVTVG
jgi:hypothetical protein